MNCTDGSAVNSDCTLTIGASLRHHVRIEAFLRRRNAVVVSVALARREPMWSFHVRSDQV
jgi:hypothetical protein